MQHGKAGEKIHKTKCPYTELHIKAAQCLTDSACLFSQCTNTTRPWENLLVSSGWQGIEGYVQNQVWGFLQSPSIEHPIAKIILWDEINGRKEFQGLLSIRTWTSLWQGMWYPQSCSCAYVVHKMCPTETACLSGPRWYRHTCTHGHNGGEESPFHWQPTVLLPCPLHNRKLVKALVWINGSISAEIPTWLTRATWSSPTHLKGRDREGQGDTSGKTDRDN